MKLPPELDALAWSIAEEDSIVAQQEFSRRFPEYADEIARRVEAVRARRDAGKAVVVPPVRLRTPRAPLPRSLYLIGGLAAGISLLVLLLHPSRADSLSQPAARAAGSTLPNDASAPIASAPSMSSGESASPRPPASERLPLSERVTTLRLSRTPLHTAIALIAEAGSLKVRIDGEVPNPEVETDITGQTPREMIESLGQTYGFRITEEAPGSLLIVPLAENGSGNS